MTNRNLKYILWLAVLLGILASCFLAWQRLRVEAVNRQVELAVDWSQVKSIARKENQLPGQALDRMKGLVSGLVFKEETVKDLQAEGKIVLFKGTEVLWELRTGGGSGLLPAADPAMRQVRADWTYLVFAEEKVMERVASNLEVKSGGLAAVQRYNLQTDQGSLLLLGTSLTEEDMATLGVGFDADGLELAAAKGLAVVPQIRSWQGADPAVLQQAFSQLQGVTVSAVFFNDESLPGIGLAADKQKEVLDGLAAEIANLSAPLGMVEFFPQKGMQSLAQATGNQVVRMHTIRQDEMPRVAQSVAVDRFTLAATDRDIRVLFVRFFPTLSLHDNLIYLDEIKTSLAANGLSLGRPLPYNPLPQSLPLLLLMAAAVAAGGILLLEAMGYLTWGLLLGGLGFLGSAFLLLTGHTILARKALALLAVMIFPTLAVTTCLPGQPAGVLQALGRFLRMTAFSLIGAALMVGLLAEGTFMVTLNQFMGVKLAHALPLLLLVLIFWFLKDRGNRPWTKIKRVLDTPIQVKYLVLLGGLVVVLAVYLLRTGNDNAAVPGWELAMRAKLEYLLAVRPRTKEFLIGHPLMILMCWLGYRDRYLPILLVGAIGQVSIVNTFAHIHTPLLISLHRAFNGVWLGTILGLLLILACWLGLKLFRRMEGER